MTKDTTAAALLALAERCEREGPSRGLDLEIAITGLGRRDAFMAVPNPLWGGGALGYTQVPCFTSSLDAAVTLVPLENWAWSAGLGDGNPHPPVTAEYLKRAWAVCYRTLYIETTGKSSTPALALCAAALRALALKEK